MSPRKVDTHARLRNKRKPPRGMFLTVDGLTSFATAPAAQADALLKKFDAELIELKRQVVCCSILPCLIVACFSIFNKQLLWLYCHHCLLLGIK